MPCQVGIFEDALAPQARTLLVLAVGEQRAFGAGWPRLSGGPPALAATAAAPWLAAAALNPPSGGFCALLARHARAALPIVGGQCWHRSADPVASAALPSRGPEMAASGASGIGLRRRCADAAVGMRRGVAHEAEWSASRAALRWSTHGPASKQRRSDVAREIARKACTVREARRHRLRLPRR
eukprot:scaffold55366_cov34-Phaeocystis_antarctica.AAC.1